MELKQIFHLFRQPHYLPFFTRYVAAILVGIYVVIEGQRKPIWKLIFDPNVYIAIIFSIAIGLLIISFIHCVTVLLDGYLKWEQNFNKRLAWQLLLCTLLPMVMDFYLVKFFFWLFKFDFEASGYIISEFPLVKLLIYGMNGFYLFTYLKKLDAHVELQPLIPAEIETDQIETNKETVQIFKGARGSNFRHFHLKDLQGFKRESGTAKVWLNDDTIWFMDYKTDEFEQLIQSKDFFKINRNVIISFNSIESYKNKGKVGEVILKPGVKFDGSLLISRDQYATFKKAMEEYIRSIYPVTSP